MKGHLMAGLWIGLAYLAARIVGRNIGVAV
jgi:hypothetical protein